MARKRNLRVRVRNHEDVTFGATESRQMTEIEIPSNMLEQGKEYLRKVTEQSTFVVLVEGPPHFAPVSPAPKAKSVWRKCFVRFVTILVLLILFLVLKRQIRSSLKLRTLSDVLSKIECYLGLSGLEEDLVQFTFTVFDIGKFCSAADKIAKFLGLH